MGSNIWSERVFCALAVDSLPCRCKVFRDRCFFIRAENRKQVQCFWTKSSASKSTLLARVSIIMLRLLVVFKNTSTLQIRGSNIESHAWQKSHIKLLSSGKCASGITYREKPIWFSSSTKQNMVGIAWFFASVAISCCMLKTADVATPLRRADE